MHTGICQLPKLGNIFVYVGESTSQTVFGPIDISGIMLMVIEHVERTFMVVDDTINLRFNPSPSASILVPQKMSG